MLETLHRIVQEVNAARDLRHALNIIVRRVAEAMDVDVCSTYLVDPDSGEFVLMSTLGLNQDAVGQVRLGRREGLVGLVGEREEPINLDDADKHPRFRYFPETGEERFHSFLGVPIIHYRQLLGVLVVQQADPRRFEDDEVAFLVTIGAQLAGAIAHSEASGGLSLPDGQSEGRVMSMRGVAGAPGVAVGEAMVVYEPADLSAVPDRIPDDPALEAEAFRAAVQYVREEVKELANRLSDSVPTEEHLLFDAYLRMLESDSLVEQTANRIYTGNWAPGALRETVEKHVKAFSEMDDPYLRERASDLRDIGRRILLRLQLDSGDSREIPERVILVGHEVSASQIAEMPRDKLVGVISAKGSGSSHVAILARAFGVPAVMGVDDLPIGRLDGRQVVVDGYTGRIYVDPPPAVREEYKRLQREEAELSRGLESLRDLPAETPDGARVRLLVNTGLQSDIGPAAASGCDGVGLHRTEVPFMVRDRFPGEKEQTEIYRQVLEPFKNRGVVLRTLDVGGDKPLPYFPVREDNPFLGWRGIRLTLDHPEIFLTQLRAMLRANIGLNNLQILLPMVSRLSELDETMELLLRASNELREEGYDVSMPPVGVMVEVPAAVYQADKFAQRVDFMSIGTNDLTQYLLAVDRNNPRVAGLYDEIHPAVLQAVHQVVKACDAHRKPISVCGGMAGDPAAAILLMGMGVDALSMSVASLLRIKWVIRSLSRETCKGLLAEALEMDSATEIRSMLNNALDDAGLGGLVRAGK